MTLRPPDHHGLNYVVGLRKPGSDTVIWWLSRCKCGRCFLHKAKQAAWERLADHILQPEDLKENRPCQTITASPSAASR